MNDRKKDRIIVIGAVSDAAEKAQHKEPNDPNRPPRSPHKRVASPSAAIASTVPLHPPLSGKDECQTNDRESVAAPLLSTA